MHVLYVYCTSGLALAVKLRGNSGLENVNTVGFFPSRNIYCWESFDHFIYTADKAGS